MPIISKEVEVKIINHTQGNYYKNLGYEIPFKIVRSNIFKLKVLPEHLPDTSHVMLQCLCDICDIKFERGNYKLKSGKVLKGVFCYPCGRKELAKLENYKQRLPVYYGDKHHNWNPNKKHYNAYVYRVRRLTEENYVKHKDIINPNDYPRTLCGVDGGYQLDHKLSVFKAYRMGLNLIIVASVQNLQMLPWETNLSKRHK